MTLTEIIRTISQKTFDLVMPPLCAYCRKFMESRTVFCDTCQKKIEPIVSQTIRLTDTKSMKVFAVSAYKDPLRSLILSKSRSDIVSSRQLGQLVWDMTYVKNSHFDFIVPIPLHWTRFARRGFNQSYEMAKVIGKKSGKPVVKLIRRIRITKYQASLSQSMRAENVKKAFILKGKQLNLYQGKHLLLVDDLLTTGSTVMAVARELYKLKPASITVVVACRVSS